MSVTKEALIKSQHEYERSALTLKFRARAFDAKNDNVVTLCAPCWEMKPEQLKKAVDTLGTAASIMRGYETEMRALLSRQAGIPCECNEHHECRYCSSDY